jgi:diguanylate cyclase (GGDEF)-like protein
MSELVPQLKRFLWMLLPPLLIYIAVVSFYITQPHLLQSWLNGLPWLTVICLGICGAIALQFGRSRLVYACLFLAAYNSSQWLLWWPEYNSLKYGFILLVLSFLLFSKDKGFSAHNLLYSSGIFVTLALLAWQVLPLIQTLSQPMLATLDTALYQLSPALRETNTPFEAVLLGLSLSVGLMRLAFKPDRTHSALFFTLIVVVAIHSHDSPLFRLISLLCLCSLFIYSVLKDSFTMAFKDELTEIPSRRALMQYVQTLGRKYVVVMSDIDHFKKFNDTYGHDVGDEVLKLVANKLSKVAGGGKTFRFGGEEFIIIFSGKDPEQVQPFVEDIRQTIADYDITLRARPRPAKNTAADNSPQTEVVKVTTSFGIAHRTAQQSDFASVMKEADIALYAAKQAGRNCVELACQ